MLFSMALPKQYPYSSAYIMISAMSAQLPEVAYTLLGIVITINHVGNVTCHLMCASRISCGVVMCNVDVALQF